MTNASPARAAACFVLAAALISSASCTSLSSPAAASSDPVVVSVDASLIQAWGAVDRPIPPSVRRVVVDDLPYSADWNASAGTIRIGRHVLASSVVVVAGVIVHELSHAEGFEHSCGGGVSGWTNDLTLDGAWGHQADFLARHGRPDIATVIRREHICPTME